MEAIIIAVILIVAFMTVLGIVRANLRICQPNEVLVFSGRNRRLTDGTAVGYRVIKGGRGFRIPIIEKVAGLDLTTIPLDLTVKNAYSRGGIPLTVRAIANVKVASTEIELNNAVERLLGKPMDAIQQIAKETLEGNLRGVVSQLTPEEVNEDRLKFAKNLIDEADTDKFRVSRTTVDTSTLSGASNPPRLSPPLKSSKHKNTKPQRLPRPRPTRRSSRPRMMRAGCIGPTMVVTVGSRSIKSECCAPDPGTTCMFSPIPTTRIRCTFLTHRSSGLSTAENHSPRSRCLTGTTTTSGSIRTTQTG